VKALSVGDDRAGGSEGHDPELDPWQLRHAGKVIAIGGAATLAVALLAIFWAPGWSFLVDTQLDAADKVVAESNVRDAGLRVAIAIGAVSAAVLGWGRLELARRDHRLAVAASLRQAEAQRLAVRAQESTETGLITDRYRSAVEQLGSADAAVRLGGLYSLQRIAKDSDADASTVYEVIAAFVRHRSTAAASTSFASDVDYKAAIDLVTNAPPMPPARYDLSGGVLMGQRFSAGRRLDWLFFRSSSWEDIAFFETAVLAGVKLEKSSWSDVQLLGATVRDVQFDDCQIEKLYVEEFAHLYEVTFDGGSINKARIGAPLFRVRFNCELIAVNFTTSLLAHVAFNEALAPGSVNLDDTTMVGVRLPEGINPGARHERRADGLWYTRDDPLTELSPDQLGKYVVEIATRTAQEHHDRMHGRDPTSPS